MSQSQNVFDVAANIPGATNVSAPNFWPNATLQARIGLSGVPDATYVNDTPRPFVLRAIGGGSRVAGALQSAP